MPLFLYSNISQNIENTFVFFQFNVPFCNSELGCNKNGTRNKTLCLLHDTRYYKQPTYTTHIQTAHSQEQLNNWTFF